MNQYKKSSKKYDMVELFKELGIALNPSLKSDKYLIADRCPFAGHEDKKGKMTIDTEKNIFRCFGCNPKKADHNCLFGDCVDFLARTKNISKKKLIQDVQKSEQINIKKALADFAEEMSGCRNFEATSYAFTIFQQIMTEKMDSEVILEKIKMTKEMMCPWK